MSTKNHPVFPTSTGDPAITRRGLVRSAVGGLSLAAMAHASLEDQIAYASQGVNRHSKPSELRITDLRIAHIQGAPFRVPIIRIDTNQGISGLGEVRDGGSPRYALMLKSRLLGENPCNVERLFKRLKQFGHHGRQGGGVSGVEMALWDLAGKAFDVPVYQMLGGRYRDKIRLYADTTISKDKRRIRAANEGEARPGVHFPEDGSGHQHALDRAGTHHRPARLRLAPRPDDAPSVHVGPAHGQGDRAAGRIRRRRPRGDRLRGASGDRPLRPLLRERRDPPGPSPHALSARMARGHDPLAIHRPPQADHHRRRPSHA